MDILLTTPKNREELELTNEDVLSFYKGYKEGYAASLEYKGENYAPKPVTLKWESNIDAEFCVSIWQAGSSEKFVVKTSESSLDFYDIVNEGEYFWQVEAEKDGVTVKSEVQSFLIKITVRTVYIEGVSNTRDIGGYKGLGGKTIPYGLVYRGALVDKITPNGSRFATEVLKIKTDLDLRNDGEGSANAPTSPLGEGVKHILASGCMYTGNEWSGVTHVGKEGVDIDEGKRKLVVELSAFADKENFPLYTHCVLGRDRTGTMIVALLALCGVSREDIMLDYELSFFSTSGRNEDTDVSLITSYVTKVLDYIDTYEGETLQQRTVAYLTEAGMTKEQMQAIQNNLLA